ncbi:DUF7504 family protein [Halospeciosus flavus]|uniref:Uncharacterized protein n=1 Tax=Halospeciosus flavus TaxID=3032283 RepID=A0ABD5Z1A2_9EURY|nr:hypothetical protein [Halospeciosus flavus]
MPAFVDVLTELKQNGCSILVTGEVPTAVTAQATRKLLGSPAAERRRALVLTDPAQPDPNDLLPGGVDPDDPDVHVVDRRDFYRGSATGATAGAPGSPLDLDLTTVLRDAVRTLAPPDGYDPSQLRTGVVSLSPLLDQYGVDPIRRDVVDASAVVRDVDGMAHFHLPSDDEDLVDEFKPVVDAYIELRRRVGHVPEQRWHVPERDFSTQWLEI